MGTARVEAFSDAVMAVIITIMAFGLRAPRGATLGAVYDQLPGLLVYVLSFVFVGIYWNNHHHLLGAAERISGAAMWANLFLLFWLSLIPVVTEWLRDEYRHALPAAAYGVVALAAGFAYAILVRALIRANGRDSALAEAIGVGGDPLAAIAALYILESSIFGRTKQREWRSCVILVVGRRAPDLPSALRPPP